MQQPTSGMIICGIVTPKRSGAVYVCRGPVDYFDTPKDPRILIPPIAHTLSQSKMKLPERLAGKTKQGVAIVGASNPTKTTSLYISYADMQKRDPEHHRPSCCLHLAHSSVQRFRSLSRIRLT